MPARTGGARDFPVAGRPRADGMLEPAEPGIFELACTSGALGKCVRFGYRPWAFAQGLELRELYNACIRMVRADYCGNGTATTKDGQAIDMYDDLGIQKPENDPAMEFEAGWTEEGAACVRHTRVKENVTLEALVAACPRLKDRVGPACTEAAARTARRAAVQSLEALRTPPTDQCGTAAATEAGVGDRQRASSETELPVPRQCTPPSTARRRAGAK